MGLKPVSLVDAMAVYIVNAVRVAAKPIITQPFLITIGHHQLQNRCNMGTSKTDSRQQKIKLIKPAYWPVFRAILHARRRSVRGAESG